jgi:NAD(P)-dependent dehydrogenase (short-subunit alcohol dehydrogenase family)
MANPFSGRTALVTGAASGIGQALADELARRGATVVRTDIDGDGLDHVLDVRDEAAFRAVARDVGRVDLLFNNAGISMGGPTHELSSEHWRRIIDVNLRGVVNGVLAVYPDMVARGDGHIVNTASAAGLAAPPFVTPYATTKHAVVGLSTSLRAEAAQLGVAVSVLCPGAVDTAILDRLPDADLPATASKPVTARAYLAVARQRPMAADVFAARALDQVARNRSIIVVPRSAKALWVLYRTSPWLFERISRTLAGQVRRRLLEPAP